MTEREALAPGEDWEDAWGLLKDYGRTFLKLSRIGCDEDQ